MGITPANHYEFTRIVRKLATCEVENLRASSADNYISFRVENTDVLIKCLEEFDKVFLTVDLRLRLTAPSSKLNEFIAMIGAEKMPVNHPYRIIAIVSSGDHNLIIQRTARKDTYIVRCLRTRNLDVVLPPSAFLITGTLGSIKNDVSRCYNLLNKLYSSWLEVDSRSR